MKIAFLGNSLTWGGYGGSFVAEVQILLPAHTIINAGESGNTVINLLRRLDSVLDQQPDGIFVMGGGNDVISYSQPKTRRYYEHVQKVPNGVVTPEQFAQHYRELLTRIQLSQILAWVGLSPMEYNPEIVDTMRHYNELARGAAEALNIPVLDLMAHYTPEYIPPRPSLDQEAINLIGQRTRIGWADYATEQKRGGFTFTFDGLHLTPEAAQQISAMVVEFLDLG
jgi:lysophospholipase L1-like esterase